MSEDERKWAKLSGRWAEVSEVERNVSKSLDTMCKNLDMGHFDTLAHLQARHSKHSPRGMFSRIFF